MTGKQRARLRAMANTIETILYIGKEGITDNTIKECVITKACVLDGASPLIIRERPEIKTIDLLEAN